MRYCGVLNVIIWVNRIRYGPRREESAGAREPSQTTKRTRKRDFHDIAVLRGKKVTEGFVLKKAGTDG